MNWRKILREGGVEEPPGREEVLEDIRKNPVVVVVKKGKRKKGGKR